MTKQDLVKIIEDNFTDNDGIIDISGLEFNKTVDMSEMKVEGSLFQSGQKVKGITFD